MKIFRLPRVRFLCLLFLTCSSQGNAVGLFSFLDIDVFTELDGIVTLAGKPLSGVQVTLNVLVTFNNEKFEITTTTDDAGRFHFDSIRAKSVNAFLPSAKMVKQEIKLSVDGKKYLAWNMTKNNYNFNGELNDLSNQENKGHIIASKINCELNNANITRKAGTHEHVALSGICRWLGE